MQRKYFKQLSYEERIKITTLRERGDSIRAIARILGRSPNTIARELREKQVRGRYVPKKAQGKTYWRRYRAKRNCLKVALDPLLARFVRDKLEAGWSPERIAGFWSRHHPRVSAKAVYKYVDSRCLERFLFWRKHKKRSGWKKNHHARACDGRKYLDARPPLAGSGHFEADFIVSRQSPWVLLVLVDRWTRETRIRKLPNRKHAVVQRAFQETFRDRTVRTITCDNDIAFNCWKTIEGDLGCQVYFCQPYRSWEKGLVENTNRWIRCWIPKRSDVGTVSEKELEATQTFLNTVPRQCLGFQSAVEVSLAERVS